MGGKSGRAGGGGGGEPRQHPDQSGERRAKQGWSNSRKWGPQGPPLWKEPGGLLEESDCVGELTPQFKGKAGDGLRQKEKGNLWALAAVGTGAAGWGTGGEESLAQRELAPSPPSSTTFPRPWALAPDGPLCRSLLPRTGPGPQVTAQMNGAQEKVSTWVPLGIGRMPDSGDRQRQPQQWGRGEVHPRPRVSVS